MGRLPGTPPASGKSKDPIGTGVGKSAETDDVKRAWELARSRLSSERLSHTEGTEQAARQLAPAFGVDPEKAALAAILHDIARDMTPDQLVRFARSKGIMVRTADTLCPILLHGKVAAAIAAESGFSDPLVLDAIASHVTGRPGWTSLEQVVYLADKIAEGRDYPEARAIRELVAAGKYRTALRESLRNAIIYAAQNEAAFVDPETVVVFNEVSQSLTQAPER